MAEYFSVIRTREHRALQVYQILIGCARNRQILTYDILAEMLGFGGAGVFSQTLGHIMFWCLDNDLPPLTVLVVNKGTGSPGPGLGEADDLNSTRERVFAYNWYNLLPPNPEQLKSAYKSRQ